MFDYSQNDLATIDKTLEPLLARAKDHAAQTEQLAMDVTRLMSVRPEQFDLSVKQPFFQRLMQNFAGQTAANVNNLYEMQRIGWRYIQILNERDLMIAHSMITVKNNLMTLAVKETETRQMLTMMANKIADRFEKIEERMGKLESQQNIHSWLLTLDTYDYPDKYPEKLRLLRIVKDFFQLKQSNWNVTEIKYLQKALKEAELPWREEITLADFIDDLIDEIEAKGFSIYDQLIALNGTNGRIEQKFILENISAPSHKSLYKIADNYDASSDMIDLLADQLSISKKDAMKKVLRGFIEKEGIDTTIKIPMRDLAVELLGCHGLAINLKEAIKTIEQPITTQNTSVKNLSQTQIKIIDNFIIHGDETATDIRTGLMWKQQFETRQFKWRNAIQYADQSNFANYNDWRLPTIEELASLIDERFQPAINPFVFPYVFEHSTLFWSSSAVDNYTARDVCFYSADLFEDLMDGYNYIRLVRG
jgi:regulator of sigma D